MKICSAALTVLRENQYRGLYKASVVMAPEQRYTNVATDQLHQVRLGGGGKGLGECRVLRNGVWPSRQNLGQNWIRILRFGAYFQTVTSALSHHRR